jgi:hypothetical protein
MEERRASTILMHFLRVEFHSAVSALKIPLKLCRSRGGSEFHKVVLTLVIPLILIGEVNLSGKYWAISRCPIAFL